MPMLDVSEVLLDSDFADIITVYQQVVTVGSNGRATRSETVTTTGAVVTPDRWATLQRQAEGANISETITVITQFRLTSTIGTRDADEIAWNGKRYIVRAVGDCSRYGAGFVEASCDLMGMAPQLASPPVVPVDSALTLDGDGLTLGGDRLTLGEA